MATDLSQLITDFYSYFLDLYHQTSQSATPNTPARQPAPGAAPPRASIAFESIGAPMTPEMFKLDNGDFDPGLVLQQFTLCANRVPLIDGTSISAPGLLTVDGAYEAMLVQAQPLAALDAEALGHIKRSAQETFDNAADNYRIDGAGGQFHPVIPGPPDWPSPSGAAAWTSRSFEQSETVVVKPAGPPGTPVQSPPHPPSANAVAVKPMPQWAWRVAPAELTPALKSTQAVVAAVPPRPIAAAPAQALAANPAVFHLLINKAVAERSAFSVQAQARLAAPPTAFSSTTALRKPMLQMAAPAATIHAEMRATSVLEASAPTLAAAHSSPVVPVTLRSDLLALHVQELSQRSTPQTVTSKNFKLSFDYCLVEAKRTWMSGSFLTARNWYVPHTKAGEISSGTGVGGGSFEVMPVAAIVVQNLVLEANWSQDDIAILQSSVSFGPFSLVGRAIDAVKNTLTCKGMQIVGWVFEPMPYLPPNSDPSLS